MLDISKFNIIGGLADLDSETRKKFVYEMLRANRNELIKRLERMVG